MLTNQPQLTLGQIPQGISAQVGPQASPAPGIMNAPQQNPMTTASNYDANQMSYQYMHPAHR